MGLSMEETVFIVEHYFRSCRCGRKGGQSLKKVAEQFKGDLIRWHEVT
jgi:hypothetical protein